MAAGNIIEVDESGEKFWIPKDRVPLICGETPHVSFISQTLVPVLSAVMPKVEDCFRKDGPYGKFSLYTCDRVENIFSNAGRHKKYLISVILPLTGLVEKLNGGALQVLDVGCGSGYHVLELAQHFPRSTFIGLDSSTDALTFAEREKQELGLKNVSFVHMNAQKLADEWMAKFDWITMFDACHDQTRPDLVSFAFSANKFGEDVAFGYAISVLACLPFGSQSEDALCLGTMWGRKRAMELLNESGFHDVKQIPLPFSKYKILYVCNK
uniref:Methyltransferase domain-containing protein n=1 Tax=Parascaris equorum TaxID=6256 RepID=A0A914RIX9_PAREQ